MTLFDNLARAAHAPQRRFGGEPVTVTARARVGGVNAVNAGMGADPTRLEMVGVTGIYSVSHVNLQAADAMDPRADNRARIGGTTRTMEFALAALAWEPRTGDLVTRATGEVFEVRGPGRKDSHGHVVYDLVAAEGVTS